MNTCRDCGAAITWGDLPSGKRAPFNPDGSVHFATCPAKRKPVTLNGYAVPDDVCHKCGSVHTERRPGTAMHFAGLKCLDCGMFRWLRQPAQPDQPEPAA